MLNDVLVIGGGPSGLTSSLLLSDNHNVTLLESAPSIGGCWKVERVGKYTVEHSPKVLFKNLSSDFFWLMKKIGYRSNLIQLYKNVKYEVLQYIWTHFTLIDIMTMFTMWITKVDGSVGKHLYKLSKRGQLAFKKIVMLYGASSMENLSMYEVLKQSMQLVLVFPFFTVEYLKHNNEWQNNMYKVLFDKDVNIQCNTHITRINIYENKIKSVEDRNGIEYKADKFIFALPLYELNNLLRNSVKYISECYFGSETSREMFVSKSTYIGVGFSFYFMKPQAHPKFGYPTKTDWNIVVSALSPTKWSVVVVDVKSKSRYLDKCVDELENIYTIGKEIARQLHVRPLTIIPHSKLWYDHIQKKWETIHSSYSNILGPMKRHDDKIPNMYVVGPHTESGMARIDTAIQSARKTYKRFFIL